ncbi:EF-Tu/IF-2/RF-3 family GTPase [Nocardioides dilutus]
MKWPWQRERTPDGTKSKDVDVLLAEADAASPTGPFEMVVEDVFTIKNRGTVATGRVGSGSVTVGQQVRIRRAGTVLSTTTVTGVEMFRKVLDSASAGDNVGLLLAGGAGDNVMRGDVLES